MGEHLKVASQHENSAIKQDILLCTVCSNVRHDLNSFEVLKQCKSDFQAKTHKALLIQKHRPSLNKQLYAHGSSFLLNVSNDSDVCWLMSWFFPLEFLWFPLINELLISLTHQWLSG